MHMELPSPTTSFLDLPVPPSTPPHLAAVPPPTPPPQTPPPPITRAPSRPLLIPRTNSHLFPTPTNNNGTLSRSASRFSLGGFGSYSRMNGILPCIMSGNGLYLMGGDGSGAVGSIGGGWNGGTEKGKRDGVMEELEKVMGRSRDSGRKEEGWEAGGGGVKVLEEVEKKADITMKCEESDKGVESAGKIEGDSVLAPVLQVTKSDQGKEKRTNVLMEPATNIMMEEETKAPRRKKIRRRRLTKEEESRYDPRLLKDLSGTTAAKSRKMSDKERDIMLHKRRLRNRASAARSREKQRKTIGELVNDYEKLHGVTMELLEVCKRMVEHEGCECKGGKCGVGDRNRRELGLLMGKCREVKMVNGGEGDSEEEGSVRFDDEARGDTKSDSASGFSVER